MIYGGINTNNNNKSKQKSFNKGNNNKTIMKAGAKLIESALKVQISALIYGVCFEVINDCDDEWQQ